MNYLSTGAGFLPSTVLPIFSIKVSARLMEVKGMSFGKNIYHPQSFFGDV